MRRALFLTICIAMLILNTEATKSKRYESLKLEVKFVSMSAHIPDHLDPPVVTIPPETTTTVPAPTTTTTTTVVEAPPETVPEPEGVEPPPEPEISEPACGPHKMSTGEAHACWDGLIAGPADDPYTWSVDRAFRIMMCESQGDYMARNPHSTATGLFQILDGPTDPAANVALAYSMYKDAGGWSPWVCRG